MCENGTGHFHQCTRVFRCGNQTHVYILYDSLVDTRMHPANLAASGAFLMNSDGLWVAKSWLILHTDLGNGDGQSSWLVMQQWELPFLPDTSWKCLESPSRHLIALSHYAHWHITLTKIIQNFCPHNFAILIIFPSWTIGLLYPLSQNYLQYTNKVSTSFVLLLLTGVLRLTKTRVTKN